MNRARSFRPVCRIFGILAVLATTLLTAFVPAPASFALPEPPVDGGAMPQMQTIVMGGMPGWQIALIAVAAAAVAAVAAVLLDRARATRRHLTAPGD
jgi:hypothetical protein